MIGLPHRQVNVGEDLLRDILARLADGRSGGIGKAFGGCEGGGIGFQEAVGVGQFQDAIDHAGGAGETKRAASGFQAGKTVDEFPEAAAVELGEFGKIEDDAGVVFADQLIES